MKNYLNTDAEEVRKSEMIAAGWRALDKTAIDEALVQNKKLQVKFTVDEVFKPHIFARGTDREQYGLMKPESRTRGYSLGHLDNAFCKLV